MKTSESEVVIAFPGEEDVAARVAGAVSARCVALEFREFPDGECYVRLFGDVTGCDVTILCSLYQPARRFLSVALIAATARDLGARSVRLISAYLPFMRQDERFHPGEGVTSRYFAKMLGQVFDSVITCDPHLHRHGNLEDVFEIPALAMSAAGSVATWLGEREGSWLMVGPDEESEQWVAPVARALDVPWVVLEKERRGDEDVTVTPVSLERWRGRTPVILDDIISTGRTMVETLGVLGAQGFQGAICVGVHAVFSRDACPALLSAGAAEVVTCTTIAHETNAIDVTPALIAAHLAWGAGKGAAM